MKRKSLDSLDTPVLLLDMDKLEANIREMARLASAAGLKLRPHTKIHECPDIARLQIEAGACGISTAKLAEAEVMADAGIDDIMVVHPFYGPQKLEALRRLLQRPRLKLSLVVDMFEQAVGISEVGQALGQRVPVLLKVETGGGRFGSPVGQPTVSLAKRLGELPGIRFAGIVAHEIASSERTTEGIKRIALEVASTMDLTAKTLKAEGIPVEHVVVGASPTFRYTCEHRREFPELTEIHPGAMVIGDVMHMGPYGTPEDRCALTVLTTVISTPAPDRAVIDVGVKTLGNDPLLGLQWKPDYLRDGRPSYGRVVGRPDLWLGRLTAEVGVIYLADAGRTVGVGERLEILPNNATLAIALHDEIYAVRDGLVERVIPVTGRGKGN